MKSFACFQPANTHEAYQIQKAVQDAQSIYPMITQVDISILSLLEHIFPAADRRCISGILFLAHILRHSHIETSPTPASTNIACLSIRTLKDFCQQPSWPFSYEATTTYLRLLCAINILTKTEGNHELPTRYYFAFQPYCPAAQQPIKLLALFESSNRKVSHSQALQRAWKLFVNTSQQITPPSAHNQRLSESLPDGQEKKRAVEQITSTINNLCQQERITLSPQLLERIAHHLLGVLQHPMQPPLPIPGKGKQHYREPYPETKAPSEKMSRNLPSIDEQPAYLSSNTTGMVDPSSIYNQEEDQACNEFNRSLLQKNKSTEFIAYYKEDLLSPGGEAQSTDVQESSIMEDSCTSDHHQQITPQNRWICPQNDKELVEEAEWLSMLFEQSNVAIGHYVLLLRQNAWITRLAVVDALYRSEFPDAGYIKQTLSGGWVTTRYRSYQKGEIPPAEIETWAQTHYGYEMLKELFADLVKDATCPPHPFPSQVIQDEDAIKGAQYWNNGGDLWLERTGICFIDVGDRLVSRHYYAQQRLARLRHDAIKQVANSRFLSPELQHHSIPTIEDTERDAFQAWMREQYDAEYYTLYTSSRPVPVPVLTDLARLQQSVSEGDSIEIMQHNISKHIALVLVQERKPCWFFLNRQEVVTFLRQRTYCNDISQLAQYGTIEASRHISPADKETPTLCLKAADGREKVFRNHTAIVAFLAQQETEKNQGPHTRNTHPLVPTNPLANTQTSAHHSAPFNQNTQPYTPDDVVSLPGQISPIDNSPEIQIHQLVT